MISITIRYFAHLREVRGQSEETMTLEAPVTVGNLFAQIFKMDATSIRFAIDAEYVSAETLVSDGDEVAFLPPMGGG
jgi:molybdopterin synthase sulfur carrier subunit